MVVSRKTVVWAERYSKIEAGYLFQFEVFFFFYLKCWEMMSSHFFLVTSHGFSQVSKYSIANVNPYTDFQGSTDFHSPRKFQNRCRRKLPK